MLEANRAESEDLSLQLDSLFVPTVPLSNTVPVKPNSEIYPKRNFLPDQLNLSDWQQIHPYFEKLLDRSIHSAKELESWLMDWSELQAALVEERTRLAVAFNLNTLDAACESRFEHFNKNIKPELTLKNDRLFRKYLDCEHHAELDPRQYGMFNKIAANSLKLCLDKNRDLELDKDILVQRYEKLSSNLTFRYESQDLSMMELPPLLLSKDRSVREATWRSAAEAWLDQSKNFNQIFDQLIAVRKEMAKRAGSKDFTEYAFQMRERFDYTAQDCLSLHSIIEQHVVPMAREIATQRKKELGVAALRPWDLEVNTHPAATLKPFNSIDELLNKTTYFLGRLHPEFVEQFIDMRRKGELDLEPRLGKTHCPYSDEFHESRRSIISASLTNTQDDLDVLVHEIGHALHYFARRHHDLLQYRCIPLEFSEVASTTMEFLCIENLDLFYKAGDAERAKREFFEVRILALPFIMQVDAFQHWIYANPDHTQAERNQAWSNLEERFGIGVDWSGLEEIRDSFWHKRSHIFADPFYYIEYGLSQLAAIEIWQAYKGNPSKAVENYRNALALGGSRPVPELYKTAGASFDFSETNVLKLVTALKNELKAPRMAA